MPQNVTRKHKPEPAGRRGTYWSENGALPVPDVVADTTGLHGGSLGLKRVNQISKGSADRLVGKILIATRISSAIKDHLRASKAGISPGSPRTQ